MAINNELIFHTKLMTLTKMEDIHLGPSETVKKSTSILLEISPNPDGSLNRPLVPISPPSAENPDSPVHSKDVPLNTINTTWLRIFRPNLPPSDDKLPIILYLHGGGFVVFGAASIFYHSFCEEMAKAVPAIVISLEYRLAPEHRLPAAYDDTEEALIWIKAQVIAGDPWLSQGDFCRCFVMGSSSGANMAYHAGLRAGSLELGPIKLDGIILNQPYFGGTERTASELASEEDVMLPLRVSDLMWKLSLPEGADRSHQFCDPTAMPPHPSLPRCLVTGCDGDPLIDRQRMFAKMLEVAGVSVVARQEDTGFHAIELFVPHKAQALFDVVREFVSDVAAASLDSAQRKIVT